MNCRSHRLALSISLSLALTAAIAPSAAAQQAEPEQPRATSTLDAVSVTGSRIKRAQVEGAQPVVTISAQQIQQEGFATVYDVLNSMNQQGSVEADTQWGSHTPNASPINLRDLGPGRTLLLVNGHRVADYPLPYGGESNFSNYSNIPSAAVERIDILTGGASAIYGSDAVAGVVNVILKRDYQGDQVRLRGGTATEGGRDSFDVSWAGGRTGENWSLTYALQATRRDPLSGRDRPEMDDSDDMAYSNWTGQNRRYGFNPFTGLSLVDANTNERLAPPAGTCARFGGEFIDGQRLSYNQNTGVVTNAGDYCGVARDYGDWGLVTGSEDYSAYLYGTWKFGEHTEAWATLSANRSIGRWTYDPPYVYLGPFQDADTGRSLYAIRQLTRREAGGWDRLANYNKEQSWDLSAGLRGVWADRFDWELSVGRSRYTVDEYVRTVDTARATDYFLGSPTGTAADGTPIYAINQARLYAPLSSSEYDELVAKSHNSAYSWVNQASFSLSGDLVQGWAGPIRFATVAEVAKQGYQLSPDPCANECYPVDVVDSGGGERMRSSAGLELQIPLLSTLSANVAGRYDRYGSYRSSAAIPTDVGTQSDTTWSAGLEWRPVESLLLRSTLATSFRAPDMHYVLGEPSSTNQTVIDQYRCIATGAYLTGGCNDENSNIYYTVDVNRRGTPDLRSETGRSFTGGVVWDIVQGLSLSVDYYRIELEEMIKDLDRDEILSAEAGCRTGTTISGGAWNNPGGAGYCDTITSRVLRNADGTIASIERGPINLAQMETSGIDASLKYRLATAGWGNFQLSLDYNNLLAYREQIYRTDSDENRRDERVRSRVRGSVHWDNGGAWDWTVYFRRLGSMRAVNWGTCERFDDGYQPSASDACVVTDTANVHLGESSKRYFGRVGPAIYWNLSTGYRITDHAKVNFYVNNVFNEVGYENKERFYGYGFYNTTLFNPIGREVAAEYVFTF
ncbi:TonB-dependent receptor plug domain-containing protein [Xanthomonas arboricola]|uniref:TonB-dependent receptor plug domain-containing protein n=1 Tax=Xanthomonas arboricola TaxID=56448 RepID=UPI003EC04708